MKTGAKVLRFSAFEVDVEARQLRKHGVRVKFPRQPFDALLLLLESADTVVTRERMCAALWPGESWGEHDLRLNRTIHRIREALNDSADTPRLIETIPRVGYRVLVPVERYEENPSESAQVSPDAPAEPVRRTSRWARVGLILGISIAAIVVGSMVAMRLRLRDPGRREVRSPVPLTTFLGAEVGPGFSPDGKQVAFSWDGEEQQYLHVFLLQLNGGGLKKLTDGPQDDYEPIWSPDGQQLAFLRNQGELTEVWLVNPDGTHCRKLAGIGSKAGDERLSWSRDPKWVIASVSMADDPPALFAISVQNGQQRRLTSPPVASQGDLSPAVSPDGRKLAFTRSTGGTWRDIFVAHLSSELTTTDEPRRLTHAERVIDALTWNSDSRELFFSGLQTVQGFRRIFRVGAGGRVEETGIEGAYPAMAPDGSMLAFVRNNVKQTSIWKLELPGQSQSPPTQSRLMSSTRPDFSASMSPDNRRLAFSSARSGATDVWISDSDGSNLTRITSEGGTQPRWSPDGRKIVFESSASGQADLYLYDLKSGSTRKITSDPALHLRPSWSRDSKSIYFCSDRSGRLQIWQKPLDGTSERQITRGGAMFAVEAFDASGIYFLTADRPPAIAWTPLGGGDEIKIIDRAAGNITLGVSRNGLFYFSSLTPTTSQLDFYDFAAKSSRPLLTIPGPVHYYLNALPDGAGVLYTRIDRRDSDIMLLRMR